MSTSTQTPAVKKFNIADFLMSVIPLFIMLFLNTVATVPAIIIGVMQNYKKENFNFADTSQILASQEAQIALTIGFVIYAVVCIIIFYFWYKKAFLKKQTVISNKEIFTVKNIIIATVGALGVSSIIYLGLYAASVLAPEVMENYSQLMEKLQSGSSAYIGELMFRGVSQAYLTRSNAHPAVVIIAQAILFGIAHMNLVQSTYAFVLGAFLGFLRYKSGNIRITIFAHIVFNVFGTFGMQLLGNLSDTVLFIIYGVLTAASIVTFVVLGKVPTAKVNEVTAAPAVNATA